jgi:hypothetical protein
MEKRRRAAFFETEEACALAKMLWVVSMLGSAHAT